ncbi:hypothetical protein B9Z19DRAFT_1094987 [Tuber borchii]|uniref:Uncharacterized protein n=1 Tax=Tuber borchii TaxID=42251 RepID=A0A2T6ZD91_TUBBO|nr:hypothetical protein B9Z19DRAFT_1094987 [Tuber borchii]
MVNECPTSLPYQYWTCDSIGYKGCCLVDPCAALGCPPGSTAPVINPAGGTQLTQTTQSSSISTSISTLPSRGITIIITTTSYPRQSPTASPTQIVTATSTDEVPTTSSAQQSPTASSTQLSGKNPGHSSSPLLSIIAISIGGVLGILIIALIIFLYRRRRRRQKSENSAGGLPTHGNVPESTLEDGSVTDERGGFLARLKRLRPTSIAKTTIELDSSPSTTYPEELPSPSFPSEHNSVIPGFAELPISSVSDLSSADRGVYSSTNVSTVSTGAVVSPHDTLRGGGRPAMTPNMVPGGRGRRKHTLSWQSFETGDGH